VYESRVHDIDIVDSAVDEESVFAPSYGPKEDILSSDNMLIEWVIIKAVKQCSKVNAFFKSVNNSRSYHKISAQLHNQELVEQLQHFKTFLMFHTV